MNESVSETETSNSTVTGARSKRSIENFYSKENRVSLSMTSSRKQKSKNFNCSVPFLNILKKRKNIKFTDASENSLSTLTNSLPVLSEVTKGKTKRETLLKKSLCRKNENFDDSESYWTEVFSTAIADVSPNFEIDSSLLRERDISAEIGSFVTETTGETIVYLKFKHWNFDDIF
ncbi:hypothetical protein MHBO_000292 [Bonamia ostreae]|uniref:Uncharacterized protein n=1 Tax=Bonamia ostreae TaxID=126728 RepID=A0ABV2AF39_9EUKA